MTSLAVVVMAHRDPPHVRRLISALEDVPIFLHCDAKTSADTAGAMADGWGRRVHPLPRLSAALDSWSLVLVELAALRAALTHSSAEHIAVLSGACYPLVGTAELSRRLDAWRGRSYLRNLPVPYPPWNTTRHRDGGRWRFDRRFLVRGDDLVFFRDVPLRWPGRRKTPPDVELRASSQWKVYARHHVEHLIRVVDERPDLVDYWRHTLVPDESFAASILSSPRLVGDDVLPTLSHYAWYQRWRPEDPHHPAWLRAEDFPEIAAASASAAVGHVREVPSAPGAHVQQSALFARKFSSDRDDGLLDKIDAELRA